MGNQLDSYVLSVSKRKSIHKTANSYRINSAIVGRLENHDIPLLLEIIRVQQETLKQVLSLADEDSAERAYATSGLNKVEELAATGDTSRWGGASEAN